jgi:hypothetical protein
MSICSDAGLESSTAIASSNAMRLICLSHSASLARASRSVGRALHTCKKSCRATLYLLSIMFADPRR